MLSNHSGVLSFLKRGTLSQRFINTGEGKAGTAHLTPTLQPTYFDRHLTRTVVVVGVANEPKKALETSGRESKKQ